MAGQQDPANAAGQQRAKRAQVERPSADDDAEHVDAVVAEPQQGALAGGPAEPPCLRDHILPMLNLPAEADLPVHFLGEKSLIRFNVDDNQNRLLLYQWGDHGGLLRRLILTPEELHDYEVGAPRPGPPLRPAPEDGVADAEQWMRKRMRAADAHWRRGGVPVNLVHHRAVARGLRLFGSKPGGGAVIKGSGYIDFVRRCGLKDKDVIEIWAFRQSGLGHGREISTCDDCTLHLAIFQKDQQTMCNHCSLLMCCHN